MPDSTWRVIGVDYGSPSVIEGSTAPRVSTYKSVPYDVAWAEEASGIDLTPCHDASGWNPTAACTGFPISPGAGVGSWSTLCQGETMLTYAINPAWLHDAIVQGFGGRRDRIYPPTPDLGKVAAEVAAANPGVGSIRLAEQVTYGRGRVVSKFVLGR